MAAFEGRCGTQLVTLPGAGGAGTTRIALEIAAAIADNPADGVWLVEPRPVRS